MNQAAADKHLSSLAREHRILIQWRRRSWHHFEAHVGERMVFIGLPSSPIRYFSALHEMGHIASPVSAQLDQDGYRVAAEAAAWEWAFENAMPGSVAALTPDIRSRIADGWATYLPRR